MLDEQDLKRALTSKKIIAVKDWDDLVSEAKTKKVALPQLLVDKKILDDEKLAEISASFVDVQYVDLKKLGSIAKEVLLLVPEPIAHRHQVVAFGKEGDKLELAMVDPDDLETRDGIKKKTSLTIVPFLISKSSLEWGLNQYHTSLEAEFAKIVSKQEREGGEETEDVTEKLKEMAEEIPVVRVVDTLLEYAVLEKASDIHIEP